MTSWIMFFLLFSSFIRWLHRFRLNLSLFDYLDNRSSCRLNIIHSHSTSVATLIPVCCYYDRALGTEQKREPQASHWILSTTRFLQMYRRTIHQTQYFMWFAKPRLHPRREHREIYIVIHSWWINHSLVCASFLALPLNHPLPVSWSIFLPPNSFPPLSSLIKPRLPNSL